MKDFLLWAFIISVAVGHPSQEPVATPRRSCIDMTPENEAQIDLIIDKLRNFLNNLTIEHEHFDIRLIKLAIDKHTADEEEKVPMLKLNVNDCQLKDEEVEAIDNYKENAKHEDATTEQTQVAVLDDESGVTTKKGELMYMDLNENGKKLVQTLYNRSKKPTLVYVEKGGGQSSYWFLKK